MSTRERFRRSTATRMLAVALVFVCCSIAQAEFHAELVQVPITEAAIAAEPMLASAQTWQLQVTADHEILMFELYVRLSGGTFYQHLLYGTDHGPPHPALVAVVPALAFDSYLNLDQLAALTAPESADYYDRYDGPIGFTAAEVHGWIFNFQVDPAPEADLFAQLTMIPGGEEAVDHQWIGRFYERLPGGGIAQHVATFPEHLGSPFDADLNLDFLVDDDDLSNWEAEFGQTGGLPSPDSIYDLDNDGDVDDIDLSILISNYLQPGTREQGDVNGTGHVNADDFKLLSRYVGRRWNYADVDQDRDVDGSDFLQWQRQVGNGFPGGIAASENVTATPEPGTLALACVGVLGAAAATAARCREASIRPAQRRAS